jgi:hypothetical protein
MAGVFLVLLGLQLLDLLLLLLNLGVQRAIGFAMCGAGLRGSGQDRGERECRQDEDQNQFFYVLQLCFATCYSGHHAGFSFSDETH